MLYSLHVCVWVRQVQQLHLTIPLVVLFVSCALRRFPRGVPGGAGMPPLVTRSVRAPQKFFFGQFLLFLADFSIFSGFLN
jgi:hypothetical protein